MDHRQHKLIKDLGIDGLTALILTHTPLPIQQLCSNESSINFNQLQDLEYIDACTPTSLCNGIYFAGGRHNNIPVAYVGMAQRKSGMTSRIKEHIKAIRNKTKTDKLFYQLLPDASKLRAVALLKTDWFDDRSTLYFCESVWIHMLGTLAEKTQVTDLLKSRPGFGILQLEEGQFARANNSCPLGEGKNTQKADSKAILLARKKRAEQAKKSCRRRVRNM